jgi:hypothetical protein
MRVPLRGKLEVLRAQPDKKVILVTEKNFLNDVVASFSPQRPMDNGVDEEGDSATDDDDNNGVGATDNNVDEDGDSDGAKDDDGDSNSAMDDDDNFDDDGDDDSDGAAADDDDNDNDDIINDVDDDNLLPRIGKRNDGCNETKREEEEMVTDSVVIHTTIKQITGRGGGGRW